MISFVWSVRTYRRLRNFLLHIILFKILIICSCQFEETCFRFKPPAGSSIRSRNDRTKFVVNIITQSHATRGRLVREVTLGLINTFTQ